MQFPFVLYAKKVPPRTLALPGPAATVVTPPFNASSTVSSIGLHPSIPRIFGVIGSVISLTSFPSKRMAVSSMPRWQWLSTKPGKTYRPERSCTSSPTLGVRFFPTCVNTPFSILKSPTKGACSIV